MMRRTGQQVKSMTVILAVIYVIGAFLDWHFWTGISGLAFLDWNVTKAYRASSSRRVLTISMIVKRHAIRRQ
jgi:hypothetical protein